MCGIAGIWGSVEDGHLTNMMGLQRHRGPDGKGTSLHPGHGVLGHTRLAIMDPGGGQQPIHNEDRSATVVANGMIYNLSLIHISEPTRPTRASRMPSSA